MLLFLANLAGTFVFGLSGGILAVRKGMDAFGVLVLAVVAALGGGMLRDVLLGRTPPATLADWRYLAVAAAGGGVVLLAHVRVARWGRPLRLFDAAGLGLFTVTGTVAALDAGLGPVPAALLGMLTGIGGGILRDVLAGEVPLVLRREIYASAALLGAVLVIVAERAAVLGPAAMGAAALATFALRMVSVARGWNLGPAGGPERPPEG
jgi:uncharacterized membrane protein YeiH